MKEPGFDLEGEGAAQDATGAKRVAAATELQQRHQESGEPDIDELVADFLSALDSFSTDAEVPAAVNPQPAHAVLSFKPATPGPGVPPGSQAGPKPEVKRSPAGEVAEVPAAVSPQAVHAVLSFKPATPAPGVLPGSQEGPEPETMRAPAGEVEEVPEAVSPQPANAVLSFEPDTPGPGFPPRSQAGPAPETKSASAGEVADELDQILGEIEARPQPAHAVLGFEPDMPGPSVQPGSQAGPAPETKSASAGEVADELDQILGEMEARPQPANAVLSFEPDTPGPSVQPGSQAGPAPEAKSAFTGEVEDELDQILGEIETRPRLDVIQEVPGEVAQASPLAAIIEAPVAEQSEAPAPAGDAMFFGAKAGPADQATPAWAVMSYAESEDVPERPSLRLLLTSADPTGQRRILIGLAAVIVMAVVYGFGYIAYLKKSVPAGQGAATSLQETTNPGGGIVQPGTVDRQTATGTSAATQDTRPTGSPNLQAPLIGPGATGSPKAKAPVPAARDDNNLPKAPQLQKVAAPMKGAETVQPGPPTQVARLRNESGGAAVTKGLESQPRGAKSAEAPPNAQQTQPPAAKADAKTEITPPEPTQPPGAPPAKADAKTEIPPAETSKPSIPIPTAAGVAGVSGTAAEEKDARTKAPVPTAEPASIASQPVPIVKVVPTYPITAQNMRISGAVEVRVAIDEKGNVTKATAISGQNLLRPAAEEALKKWKFKPAMLHGEGVKSEFLVTVNFVR